MTQTALDTQTTNGAKRTTERWLEGFGITEYRLDPRVPIDKVDEKLSLANQARQLMGGVDDDHVLLYMEALAEDREALGPIVVKKLRSGRLKILDGIHRFRAWKLSDFQMIPCYIIDHHNIVDQQETLLIYTANIAHGLPTTLEQRVFHAISLTEQYGMTIAEAARQLHVPAKHVSGRLQIVRTISRFEMLGLRNAERKLGRSSVARLGSIQSDEVVAEAFKLAADAKMGSEAVNKLVTEINKARSEKQKLAVIERARQEVARDIAHSAAGRIPKPKPIASIEATLSRVLHIDTDELREALAQVTSEQRAALKARTAQASQELKMLAESI